MKEIDDNVLICASHEKYLGDDFLPKISGGNTYCLWPSHKNKRKCGTLRNPFPFSNVAKKQSLFLFSKHNIVLPFQSKICKTCSTDCRDKLTGFIEENVRSPLIKRSALKLGSDCEFSQSTVASQSSAEFYEPHSQEFLKDKKSCLDDLLAKNNIKVPRQSLYHGEWSQIQPERKRQVLNYMGAGVASVIQTVVPNESKDGQVYKDLKESKYVEKHLHSEVPPTEFIEEIILSANNAGSRDALEQYLSTLYRMPGIDYKFLSQFNRSANDESSDESDSDSETSSSASASLLTKLRFNFNFNKYLWMSAIKRRLRHGYGNARVIKEKSFKWHYNTEVIMAIYDFVVSPLNTLRNSYGVINIKEESGQISTIGKVIRHQNNSDMVKNIMAHLRARQLPVPSSSFIFKFLTYLPAASLKEMKGVNNYAEDCMRAFKTLDDIVERYANECSLPDEERKNLKTCLSNSKTYLKTKYYDNLSFNSPYLSHCVSCACSDPNDNKKFIAPCENKHQDIKCENCEMIYDTLSVIMKLMENYRDEEKLSKYDAAVIYKRIIDSQNAIFLYQIHLNKVYCQENEWQRLIDKCDPETVFFEGDWAMKFLPRMHREKQSAWFGKNGISYHIGVFTRIVPNSFESDGITPKDYKKVPDTYVSIVEDSSKQDALTTAAIIKENIKAYKKNNPQVKKVWLRSDNAGCYKSSKLIQALHSIDDIDDLEIMGYVFSAPCDGKSLCDTYAAIIKHHIGKMVNSGQMDVTTPKELAEAAVAASGIANVVVMCGSFAFEENPNFKTIPKITDLNTFRFLNNSIIVWKQNRFGEGLAISLPKISFPSEYLFEFVGSSIPRRKENQTLMYRMSGEREIIEGDAEEDYDDDFDADELEMPIMEGSIYKCPQENCDAEYLTLGKFFEHQITRKCFQKIKKRTESIKGFVQRLYIEKYNMNQSEKLTKSEVRYKHMLWDEEENAVSLLPTFHKSSNISSNLFKKGFAVITFRTKNVIQDDVRAFVREKYDEGELTNRHMSYPKIVTEIEKAKDDFGNPRFFPDKWLDSNQVAYLITKFMKDSKTSKAVSDEDLAEQLSINVAQENFARRRDGLQDAIESLQSLKPLSEQSHPLMLQDNTNICDIAQNYHENEKTKDSWIMQEDFSNIKPILEAMDIHLEGKRKRQAGKAILNYVKTNCKCIPLRRKRNA